MTSSRQLPDLDRYLARHGFSPCPVHSTWLDRRTGQGIIRVVRTLEHSSGAVEGNVTRVKKLKRDSYGHANFDLLRARILLATCTGRHVIIARAELQVRRH